MNEEAANTQLEKDRRALLEAVLAEQGLARESLVIPQRASTSPPPLSFAQQRLWFLDRLAPNNPFYNCSTVLPVHGQVLVQPLTRAVNALVARHEALRTTFRAADAQAVQIIAPSLTIALEEFDLSDAPTEKGSGKAARLIEELALEPFDLEQGPLLRAVLVRLHESEHALALIAHHIVVDGWSLRIIVRELQEYYLAFCTGSQPELPGLPIQYADFAVWQRNPAQAKMLEHELIYWKHRLTDLQDTLVPTDWMRPAIPSFRGAFETFSLPKPATQALQTLARQERATMFMVLLAAFKALLSRYSGQEDIVVGSPVANRNRGELENLVGFFVNNLVLRTSLAGDPSFRELIVRARQTALEAFDHQNLPFERLVDELHVNRDLSRNPLFQISFQFFTAAADGAPDLAEKLDPLAGIKRGTAKFDLRFDTWESAGGIEGQLEYSTDLFARDTVKRMVLHFRRLLTSAVRDPDRPLSELRLLDEREAKAIIGEWCGHSTSYPTDLGIHELFEKWAQANANAVALYSDERTLTYGALDEAADRVAYHLRSYGLTPETPVGVYMERSFDFVIAILGILKAGGAYVPLDPSYPAARVAYMLQDVHAPVVLTTAEFRNNLPSTDARVECVESLLQLAADAEPLPAIAGSAFERLAYIMYTSGSTGQPKGVCVPHRAIVRLAARTNFLELEPTDVVAHVSSISFDAATFEIWNPLAAGARICIISREDVLVSHRLSQRLEDGGVTAMFLTTPLFNQIVEEVPDAFSGLDVLLVGGSTANPRVFRKVLQEGPPGQLVNVYGPTENTTFSTYCIVSEPPEDGESVPIGRPVANSTAYILDRHLQPVPVGVTGDLYVGGDGLATGYWNRPELTAQRFIEHPFVAEARLYRTGDRARYLPDRYIEYLGREDNQVKLRGFRVELDEIDARLATQPGVNSSVSVVRKDLGAEPRIVTYVVWEESPSGGDATVDNDTELVSHWRLTYDEMIYRHPEIEDDGDCANFNTTGWISSYTGKPLPDEDMQEQVAATTTRIAAFSPRHVLEIGCGMGLILHRLAPKVTRYVGTEISEIALDTVRGELARATESTDNIELLALEASQLDVLETGAFDTVILNSVIQYFPSVDYLRSVLKSAVRRVSSGGQIFIGDVRSFDVVDVFYTSVELVHAPDSLPIHRLNERVAARAAQEQELVIAPAFFLGLSDQMKGICAVEVQQKRGWRDNELTEFRYDVVLHIGDKLPSSGEIPTLAWDPSWRTADDLRQHLAGDEFERLLVGGIPNARLCLHAEAYRAGHEDGSQQTVGDVRRVARARASKGIHPEAVWGLANELGLETRICWTQDSDGGAFDAFFTTAAQGTTAWPMSFPGQSTGEGSSTGLLSSDPVRGHFQRNLIPRLRIFLQAQLPDYMQPSAYVLLQALPLTANGKIDTNALPTPNRLRPEIILGYEPPTTDIEHSIATIWSKILGMDQIGTNDHFFAMLGGNSLDATQVISQIRGRLHVEVPLRLMFETPTVAALAQTVETLLESNGETVDETTRDIARATVADFDIHVENLSDAEIEQLLARLDFEDSPQKGLESDSSTPLGWDKRTLVTKLSSEGGALRVLPMSFSQQRLWFLDQLSPGNAFYNVEASIPIPAHLDIKALSAAINQIVSRHEILRTTFCQLNGQPVQVVVPSLRIDVSILSLGHLDPTQREAEKNRLVTENARRKYDLARGPLLAASVVQLGPNDQVFLLGMHHIIADGWSLDVMSRELLAFYEAELSGQPATLPALPIQYGDFAVWQRKWLTGSVREHQLGYWLRKLTGLEPTELPADRLRPAVQSYRGAFHRFSLSNALSAKLNELSRREDSTLFMTLLAAFKLLLHRWSGAPEVVIGTYIANRNRAETEGLIGFFLNTLVLRTRVEDSRSFRSLLHRVREVALGAYEHQDFPFEALVEELQPERDLSRNPLFQVSFQLNNSPAFTARDGAEEALAFQRGTSIFDIAFMMFETPDGLVGNLEYSTDLFDKGTIERLATRFDLLLREIVRDPDVDVHKFSLLTSSERRLIVRSWNDTAKERAWEVGILDLFAEQVAAQPTTVAYRSGRQSLTFLELDRRSNRLANYLINRGVTEDVVVGLGMELSVEAVVVILAVVKTGGAWLPLACDVPPARIISILGEADAQIAVVDRAMAGKLQSSKITFVCLEDERDAIDRQSSADPGRRPDPEAQAYVLFTSGSTGRPKGVSASHLQILNRLHWMWEAHPFASDEVGVLKTSLSFIDSIWEIFGSLLCGRPTAVIEDNAVRDPHLFLARLAEERVTRLWLVPSYLGVLLDSYPDIGERLPDLRFFVTTGEPLTLDVLAKFRSCLPGRDLYNLYGTTEVWDATYDHVAGDGVEDTRLTMGKPIDNVRVYVLDDSRQPVPLGDPGLLYVAGLGLARGYFGRPDLTDAMFVELTLEGEDTQRAWYSGDRVRFLDDGRLEFLGRVDQQVKIRGFRVDPSEVEIALADHPHIEEVAVAVREGASQDAQLFAWYVPKGSPVATGTELRAFLQSQLPAYMLPASLIPIEQLPRTPSGKIDRRSLQLPSERTFGEQVTYVAPRSDIERSVADIWSEVLGVEQLGVEQNFFSHLGGHSLLAIQLISRTRNAFDIELPIRALFEHPTIESYAAYVADLTSAPCRDPVTPGTSVRAAGPPKIKRLARNEYLDKPVSES